MLRTAFPFRNQPQVWCEDCNTFDDDGERMMACDECGVWKHTRCMGTADDQEEPESFICPYCIGLPSLQ